MMRLKKTMTIEDENENDVPKTLHSQAISEFDTCIKYAEEQEFAAGDILKLITLRDVAYKKKNETKLRQMKIKNFVQNH